MKALVLNVITAALLFLLPKTNFGQAPTLGDASSFALFTSVGAFGNTGASTIKGDIGTNVGAFTGFPPGTVIGDIHVADSISAEAASDVETAYSFLGGVTCDSVIGVTLGSGQVLNPGVYCIGAASTLNGDLTLDAQGNSAALFIIKIDGAFITGAASNVILIDSATVCNVYWQINGAVDIGVGSVFQGTILGNGRISLLGGTTLIGRGLTRAGTINVQDDSVIVCTQASGPVPVSLIAFYAKKTAMNPCITLHWETASEHNSDYFLIERSDNGILFSAIGRREAAGNSTNRLAYSFQDESPNLEMNYYRLREVDMDGMSEYSPVIEAHFPRDVQAAVIYPNPFNASTNVFVDQSLVCKTCELRIYNAWGDEVLMVTIDSLTTRLETSLLPSGIYFYKLSRNNAAIRSGRLVSAH